MLFLTRLTQFCWGVSLLGKMSLSFWSIPWSLNLPEVAIMVLHPCGTSWPCCNVEWGLSWPLRPVRGSGSGTVSLYFTIWFPCTSDAFARRGCCLAAPPHRCSCLRMQIRPSLNSSCPWCVTWWWSAAPTKWPPPWKTSHGLPRSQPCMPPAHQWEQWTPSRQTFSPWWCNPPTCWTIQPNQPGTCPCCVCFHPWCRPWASRCPRWLVSCYLWFCRALIQQIRLRPWARCGCCSVCWSTCPAWIPMIGNWETIHRMNVGCAGHCPRIANWRWEIPTAVPQAGFFLGWTWICTMPIFQSMYWTDECQPRTHKPTGRSSDNLSSKISNDSQSWTFRQPCHLQWRPLLAFLGIFFLDHHHHFTQLVWFPSPGEPNRTRPGILHVAALRHRTGGASLRLRHADSQAACGEEWQDLLGAGDHGPVAWSPMHRRVANW